MNINEYIDNNKDTFINISLEKNIDKDTIIAAHEIVKKFIIDRGLIIFGGLAIDYALKIKGSYIYSANELPDYDCLSKRNVDDAYDLGDILYNIGFENVKVIKAKHVETMRVRVNLITVIDIGYSPYIYFEKYKTLKYNDMNILHPDMQRLDLHKAFCFPLSNPPMEDIFHRWEKDIKRFNLFEKYYPIKISKIKINTKKKKYTLPISIYDKKYATHGFMAYALFCKEILKYIDKKKLDNVILLDINYITEKECSVDMPIDENYIFVTDTSNKTESTYYTILGLIPESYIKDNISIFFVDMLSIVNIDNIQVVSIQYLLLYFLFYANFDNDMDNRKIYKNFYLYTLQLITLAEDLNNLEQFMPSLTYLGNEPLFIPQNDPNLPVNYNPDKIGTRQIFDYSNYKISGEKI